MVIRGDVKINSSPTSGTGDPILTRDAASGIVGEISTIDTSVFIPTTLTSGYVIVGNASNVATGVAMTGDVTITNAGVTAISSGVIVNADINASAAIALTKLATVTASRALVSDGSGYITTAAVTATELGYVSGVTSSIQTQLDAKQATITGGATTIVSSNLTVSRALVSDGSGKVAVSSVTSTELGYLSGVSSNVQTQLNSKQVDIQFQDEGVNIGAVGAVGIVDFVGAGVTASHSGGTVTVTIPGTANGLPTGGTAGQVLIKDSGTDYDASFQDLLLSDVTDVTATAAEVNILSGATLTTTELNYVDGVTSSIQTQLDSKLLNNLAQNAMWYGDASNQATQLSPGSDGQVLTSVGGVPTWVDSSVSGTYGFQGQAYAVWTGSGLIFDVYWPDYYINGVLYSSGTDQVTLDPSDPTYDRFDVIGVDAAGVITITGTAENDPVIPTVDSLTELFITSVFIEAGATTPVLVTDEDIYLENAEWTGSSTIAGADFANTTDPFAGTIHFQAGSFSAGQYVRFVDGVTHDISDFNYIKFYVKLRATFASTAGFIISFRNGATVVSSSFTVTNGIYAFDRTDTSGYQLIVIPLSEFTFSSATFDTVNFEMRGTNATGFRLDNVVLQGGISGTSVEQNALVTISTDSGSAVATQANDTFNLLGKNGTVVDAASKTINVEGVAGGTASGTDTYTVSITGVTAYTSGQVIKVNFTNANTGVSTLNVNSLGAKSLKKSGTTDLSSGDINAGQAFVLYYDGTNYQVIGIGGGGGTPGGADTYVQYNDGGSFGGEAAFTYDKTTNKLTVDAILLNGETASRFVTTDASKNLDTPYTFIDDDSMATASATAIPSSESVKAYVDAQVVSESTYAKIQAIWYHLNSF